MTNFFNMMSISFVPDLGAESLIIDSYKKQKEYRLK